MSHPLWSRWMQPGERLLNRMSMRSKLLLVAACSIVPLALLAGFQAYEDLGRAATLQRERQGLALHHELLQLAQSLHKSRALAADPSAAAVRGELARAIESQTRQIEAGLDAATRHSDAWQSLQRSLAALSKSEGASGTTRPEASEAMARLLRDNAERSAVLMPAAQLDHARAALMVRVLPPLADSVAGTVEAAGASLAQAGDRDLDPLARSQMLARVSQLDHELLRARTEVERVQRTGTALPQAWTEAHAAVELLGTSLLETFARERPDLPPAAMHRHGFGALGRLHDLQLELLGQQAASADARITAHLRRIAVGAGAVGLMVLLSGYLLLSLYRSFSRTLKALLQGTHEIAAGNLSNRLELPGRDELANICGTVNGMGESLSALVAEIRTSAARVNMAGSQVAEGSQRLSQRTEEQAVRLRESVESISQLSQAVQDNAGSARELDQLTEQLARKASVGHAAMGETIQAVTQLQESSRRVFEVVKVIDDVAFQTSMLSLNAAVEAARAGDAGRGFALVASEVRSLAQRVGDSADEIRTLITQASDQLDLSGSKLGSANGALQDVVSGVHEASARLRQIAQASTEQSETLISVARNVGDLDEITRDNARLVDESTLASQALLERAGVLRDAVASMKLRQGSADEARELLERGWEHVQQVGLEQGLEDLHDRTLGFIDRDLYVFALDRDGNYIACGAKPEMVGTNVNALPGIRGTAFVADVWAAAEAGGGWVQYEIANPLTGEVTPKESYVRQLDDRLLLGCGIYRRAAVSAAKPRAAAWSTELETKAVASY